MKAREVLKSLQRYDSTFSRATLSRYVENGYIIAKRLPSGRLIYDANSVKNVLNVLKAGNESNKSKRIIAFYGFTKSAKRSIDRRKKPSQGSSGENKLFFNDNNKRVAFSKKDGLKALLVQILQDNVKELHVPSTNVFGPNKTKGIVTNICIENNVEIIIGDNNE